MRTVCDELSEIKHKYYEIGTELGVDHHMLERFRKGGNDPLESCINYWLGGNIGGAPRTWNRMARALRSSAVNESGIAKIISDKFCLKGTVTGLPW